MTDSPDAATALAWLRTPDAIRNRCGQLHAAAEAGNLHHFMLDTDRLDAVADYVLAEIRFNYPDLNVPCHSRWRHFGAGGVDRWAELAAVLDPDPAETGRIRTELAIVSVLLDAGAGPRWSYRDRDGRDYSRSEGLAVASLAMYRTGLFSSRPDQPLRVDAAALTDLDETSLAAGFRHGPDNPLVGLDGRLALLRRLGGVIVERAECFGTAGRLGDLFDHLAGRAGSGGLPAANLLSTLLETLGPIWPGRLQLDGVNLGDIWHHPRVQGDRHTDGLVPFHKLSQWLTYSLIEPLEDAGVPITGLDALTGLPEYRNGGLFVDFGVLVPGHAGVLGAVHRVESELVVEWRALTVCLLDRLAERIRQRLGLDAGQLPLARILEGGSWAAGRRIARKKRPDGRPPITIISDGTVF
jgi:hypothetical protein